MRYAPVAMVLLLLSSTLAIGGDNPQFTLPMHATVPLTFTETCVPTVPMDCALNLPLITIPAAGGAAIYQYVANHAALAGVAMDINWPATWLRTGAVWDLCQDGQLNLSTPGLPTGGLLSSAFNCVTDAAPQVVGYQSYIQTPDGCITIGNASGPIQALDCNLNTDDIDPSVPGEERRLGSVCVETPGFDACEAVSAVEPATWGTIKAQYK